MTSGATGITAYDAFRAYAIRKLGVPEAQVNGGGPRDAATAAASTASLPSVGNAWAYAYNTSAGGAYREVRGWALPDGRIITADENLGMLFAEAGVWSQQPKLDAAKLAAHITWSLGMSYTLVASDPMMRVAPPKLEMLPNGSGTLVFTINFRPPGPGGGAGGGPPDHTTITVTLTPPNTAVLTRAPGAGPKAVPTGSGASVTPSAGSGSGASAIELLTAHFAKQNWPVSQVFENVHIPGLYKVHHVGIMSAVVREGRVITEKGLDAAGAHMKAVDLLKRPGVDGTDILELLTALGALPPNGNPEDYVAATSPLRRLVPALDTKAGTFVFHYVSNPSTGGARANANELLTSRYTLTIPPSYKLAYASTTFWYDKVTHAERPL